MMPWEISLGGLINPQAQPDDPRGQKKAKHQQESSGTKAEETKSTEIPQKSKMCLQRQTGCEQTEGYQCGM